MYITANDFQALGKAITAAKQDPDNYCDELRAAPEGAEDQGDGTYTTWQPVSGMPQSAERRKKWTFRELDDGGIEKRVTMPLGKHGIAFLGIDPATLEVACVACNTGTN